MESRNTKTTTPFHFDNNDITTWKLPDGAIARLGRGDVRDMAFSPDGQYFTVASGIGLWLYELPTLSPLAFWDTERGMISKTFFSADSRRIVTYTFVEYLKVWNVQNGTCATQIESPDRRQLLCPIFSQDGEHIAAASYENKGKIYIWCSHTGRQLSEVEIGETYDVFPAQFSPDIKLLAGRKRKTDSDPESILVWHVETGEQIGCFTEYSEKMEKLGFWRDNVLLWDVANRRSYRPQSEKLPGTHHNVYLSADKKIISTSVDRTTLKVWEVGNSKPIAELAKPEAGLGRAEAFTSNGYRLACVDRESKIHIWEGQAPSDNTCKPDNWEKHATLVGHASLSNRIGFSWQHIVGMAFSPDGKRLASIARDCIAYLWDVDSGKQIAELSLTPPPSKNTYHEYDTGIAFSPCGDIIAGGKWGEIVLWDATDGKTVMTLPQPEGSQRPITLCFSPCGQYLASGTWWQPRIKRVSIRLWKVASGKNIATFWGHTTDVQCFAFSKDGTLLVSGGHDGSILLWNLIPYL